MRFSQERYASLGPDSLDVVGGRDAVLSLLYYGAQFVHCQVEVTVRSCNFFDGRSDICSILSQSHHRESERIALYELSDTVQAARVRRSNRDPKNSGVGN